MKTMLALMRRNIKLFFKDKGMFFTSLITPLILLVLYTTFLGNVFEDSVRQAMGEAGGIISDGLINGFVGGQLVSSLLAVSCVTVAFCANMLMVQDKFSGARRDLTITPVKASVLSLSYYIATALVTLVISLVALGACLIYIVNTGWYLSMSDVLYLILDVFLLSMFGTALSSVVNFFLSTQGQVSAVGSIVSAGYGFICGAYMPISSFGEGLQTVVSFLPGTYGTSLFRNHAMQGVFEAMEQDGLPQQVIDGLRDMTDCNPELLDHAVTVPQMYGILGGVTAVLVVVYILQNKFLKKKMK
ncbi:MAG: ABC transporter permease [Clostridia bacterium]|nr:ABC transporter permease [Clostridia bacterium]